MGKLMQAIGDFIDFLDVWDLTLFLTLILGIIMGWRMRLLDFVLAFPQAEIKTDIFMKIPCHCSVHKSGWKNNILKLKKIFMNFATLEGHGMSILLRDYSTEDLSSQKLTHAFLSRKR